MANEGARILGAGTVLRAVDIDIICVLGYGFPAYRGGPMWIADQTGLDKVLAAVRTFYELLGERWRPAPLLEQLATERKKLASVRPQ